MKIDVEKLKFKIRLIEDKKWKAIVTIDFGDFNIKGYRVWDSEFMGKHGEYLWITPPVYNSGFGFKSIVYIKKYVWEEIEKELVKAYLLYLSETAEERMKGLSNS